MSEPDPQRDCHHGQLARSCDRCADAAEIADLRAALQEADTIMGHGDAETAWRERWAGLWAKDKP